MFDLKTLMPLVEKHFNIKKDHITSADEFKAALQKLNTGTSETTERYLVEGEFQGKPVICIAVLK